MPEHTDDRTEVDTELVIAEAEVEAAIDVVWRALREPAEIRRWHGWDDETLDEEIRFIYLQDAVPHEDRYQLEIPGVGARFTLRASDNGTIVAITKPGVTPTDSWDEIYDEIDQGWISFLQQMRFALARHPGQERRASYVVPSAAMSLDDVGLASSPAPGEPYSSVTAWGDRLAGEVWFRSRHQLGVTVTSYGDGLVILHTEPGGAVRCAIITTYLDDASSDAVHDRWAGTTRFS